MPAPNLSPGPVETLVRVCQSRVSSHRRRRETFFALAVALGGVCLLFLLGTRYVPAALAVLTAMFGVWMALERWRSDRPTAYEIAQQIDRREGLSDQLATAYYFRSVSRERISGRIVDLQYTHAAGATHQVDPRSSFPKIATRSQRTSVWLFAGALVLFGLRASVQTELSFEPPLATLLFSSWFDSRVPSPDSQQLSPVAIDEQTLPDAELESQALGRKRESATESLVESLPEEPYEPSEQDEAGLPEVEGLITLPLEDLEAEGLSQEASVLAHETDDPTLGEQDLGDLPTDTDGTEWSEEAQSLLDKLKQAFSNMLETLDMAAVESASSEQGQEQGSGTSEEASSSGNPSETGSADQEAAAESGDASMEGGEPGDTAGEAASAGNTSGEDSSGNQRSGEDASAAGTSDGSKEFVEAEQVEVFGELENLYMERAEKMKGEVTIETRLAEPSAGVPYNQRFTSHADTGSAISRDEVPAAFRTYIKNYFETLRGNTE